MSSLLQSTLWAKVQNASNRRTFFIDDILLIKHSLPFKKSYFYSPHPKLPKNSKELKLLNSQIQSLAKKEQAIFWKVEGVKKVPIFKYQFSITHSPPLQYSETYIIDLKKSDSDILANMKQKTRYNIRLAKKRGVTIQFLSNLSNLQIFYKLLQQTASRQKIKIHSKKHYEKILKFLSPTSNAALGIAYYKKTPIAANLITFYKDTSTYLHGGTSNKYREVMAPYLLQWKSMLEARRRNCTLYDMGGCAVTVGKIDAWAGITRFKAGFGGTLHQFGDTFDVVFDKKWYWLYKLKKLLN